tara:strand:+ start:4426 stop:5559 length:1134 start_codon:yes stop_codon:yes gene_type:complete
MSISLRSVIPENYADTYSQNDNIDFVLSFPNEVLNLGSVRLEGELVVVNGNPQEYLNSDANKVLDICLDPLVGAHSLCESIQTEVLGSIIENCSGLPRFHKMRMAATIDATDTNNAQYACELKAPFRTMTNRLLRGEVPITQLTDVLRENPDFSIKPDIALNSVPGQLPYRRSGDIRVSVNLARTAQIFHGQDVSLGANGVNYAIRDFRLTYTTYPDDGSMNDPIQMRTKVLVKQSVNSRLANNSSKVPGIVDAVSVSFIEQSNVNVPQVNTLQLARPPNVEELMLNFNDSTNKAISFVIRDNVETIGLYLNSFGANHSHNSMSVAKQNANNGFGIGLDFGAAIDMRMSKFSSQMISGVVGANAYTMSLYFHSSVSL